MVLIKPQEIFIAKHKAVLSRINNNTPYMYSINACYYFVTAHWNKDKPHNAKSDGTRTHTLHISLFVIYRNMNIAPYAGYLLHFVLGNS